MNLDITDILDDWPYHAGQINVRTIVGKDGKQRIQMRLDMGLLQMETTGRPDGKTPYGKVTLLEHYLYLKNNFTVHNGSDKEFSLSEAACKELHSEAVMYYHRYLAEFVLEDFDAVIRDTKHNLAIINLCTNYGKQEEDRLCVQQHKPYIIMMNIRSRIRRALRENKTRRALAVLERGIILIETTYRDLDQEDLIELSSELQILKSLRQDIRKSVPISQEDRIKEKLRHAVEQEHYEEAAALRDQLKNIHRKDKPI